MVKIAIGGVVIAAPESAVLGASAGRNVEVFKLKYFK